MAKKINSNRLNKNRLKRLEIACKLDDFATYLETDVAKEKRSFGSHEWAKKIAKNARKQAKRAWTSYRKACKIRRK